MKKGRTDRSEMKAFMVANPEATTKEIMKRFKVESQVIYQVKNALKAAGKLNGNGGSGNPQNDETSIPIDQNAPVITTRIKIDDMEAEVNISGIRTILNGVPGKPIPWSVLNALTH